MCVPLLEPEPELLEDELEFELDVLELFDELELLELDELDELLVLELPVPPAAEVLPEPVVAVELLVVPSAAPEVTSPVDGLEVAAVVGVELFEPAEPASPLVVFGSVAPEATSEGCLAAWARPI